MQLIARAQRPRAAWALEQAGAHPLLAQLYAARGLSDALELDMALTHLLAPETLRGADAAAELLWQAIDGQRRICIVADYDCDGATACAVAVRGLRLLGAQHVHYLVPNRLLDGYGLTPAIARRVHASGADLLVTVDNGIASAPGVEEALALGMQVLITDHHLPGEHMPRAHAIVNPNQQGCTFGSKALSGVGVMFYVLMALRAHMRQRGAFAAGAPQPRLDALLPLVALGTVADVVALDANNRRLVAQGLQRIRAGAMPAGMAALFAASGRNPQLANTFDLGFALGPRINAAGRLDDMSVGIECLLAQDGARAAQLAQQLDAINRSRRLLETDMKQQAQAQAQRLFDGNSQPPAALCVCETQFHEGLVGLLASRLKDRWHRPCFVFTASSAPGAVAELKGSGRSIEGFHLRDALDLIAKRHPGVLLRFGGHAAAAGCTIAAGAFEVFSQALALVATQWLDAAALQQRLYTDGALPAAYRRSDIAALLQSAIWGQGFAAPVFAEELDVLQQRIVGEQHLKLRLRHQGEAVDAIWFGRTQALPARAKLAWRLDANTWQGQSQVQFIVQAMQD